MSCARPSPPDRSWATTTTTPSRRSLVERLDAELGARERERRAAWLRETVTVLIALGSVGLGVLVAATAGEIATIVAWIVIAVVNVAHARRR